MKYAIIPILAILLISGCTEHAVDYAVGRTVSTVASSQINKKLNEKVTSVCDTKTQQHIISVAEECLLKNVEPYIPKDDIKEEKIDLIERSYRYCIKSELEKEDDAK